MEVLIDNRQQSSHNEWDSQQYKANQDVRVGRFFWEDDCRYIKLFHFDIFFNQYVKYQGNYSYTPICLNTKSHVTMVCMGILMYNCDQKSWCFWSPSSSLAPRGLRLGLSEVPVKKLNVSLFYPLQNQFCARVEEFGGTTGHERTPSNDALQLVLLS